MYSPPPRSRAWFPLGVAGTPGCASALRRLSSVVRAKHVHEETIRLLAEALPEIAKDAEAEEQRVAGRGGGEAAGRGAGGRGTATGRGGRAVPRGHSADAARSFE